MSTWAQIAPAPSEVRAISLYWNGPNPDEIPKNSAEIWCGRSPFLFVVMGNGLGNLNRVFAVPGDKSVVSPIALDAIPVGGDQDAMSVALALGVFAVEFHIGLAVFGPF